MNTSVTRPGHLVPNWRDEVGGWALLAEDTASEAKAEAHAARWLERIMWASGGACIGCLALWVSLVV